MERKEKENNNIVGDDVQCAGASSTTITQTSAFWGYGRSSGMCLTQTVPEGDEEGTR